MRGLAVENPDDAPVAISYAIWSERRYRWVAVLMGGLGALNIYISSNKSWTSVCVHGHENVRSFGQQSPRSWPAKSALMAMEVRTPH